MARRPNQVRRRAVLSSELICKASYVGSAEHKAERWWGGLPKAYIDCDGKARRPRKQDTTICHLTGDKDRERATSWVRQALLKSQVQFREGDKDFPKHIWYKDDDGQIWFGLCINSIQGEYKGWPIDEKERRRFFD